MPFIIKLIARKENREKSSIRMGNCSGVLINSSPLFTSANIYTCIKTYCSQNTN